MVAEQHGAPIYRAVCLYPRKSPATGRKARTQEEISLEYQEERMRAWCTEGGHTVAAVRPETHHRYMLKSRPALRQVLEECRQGRYDLVLAYDVTRLCSKSNDYGWIEVELRDAGVPLRLAFDDVPEGPFSGAIKSMKADGSGEEVKLIRRRTSEGKEKRMTAKGLPLARPAPYGMWWNHEAEPRRFPRADQRYAYLLPKRDDTAEVMRRVYGELAAGRASLGTLVRQLNAEGVPGPHGGVWQRSSLGYLAHNPAYCGLEATGRTRRRLRGRGEAEEWVREPRAPQDWRVLETVRHRPLVSRDVWEAAQRALAGNTRRASSPDSLASRCLLGGGRATCAGCGGPLWSGGRSAVSKEGDGTAPVGVLVTYYQCAGNHGHARDGVAAGVREACPAPAHVRADVLDHAVWQAVLDYQPVRPTPERSRQAADDRERQRKRLVAEQRKVVRDLRAGEQQVLHLTGYRRAAAEANNEAWAGRLAQLERELDELAGAARADKSTHAREVATFRALSEHRADLLACRPWDTGRDKDEAMRALVGALDVRAQVAREKGPSKTRPVAWALSVAGHVVAEGGTSLRGPQPGTPGPGAGRGVAGVRERTGRHLRLDTTVIPDPAALAAALARLRAHQGDCRATSCSPRSLPSPASAAR